MAVLLTQRTIQSATFYKDTSCQSEKTHLTLLDMSSNFNPYRYSIPHFLSICLSPQEAEGQF